MVSQRIVWVQGSSSRKLTQQMKSGFLVRMRTNMMKMMMITEALVHHTLRATTDDLIGLWPL